MLPRVVAVPWVNDGCHVSIRYQNLLFITGHLTLFHLQPHPTGEQVCIRMGSFTFTWRIKSFLNIWFYRMKSVFNISQSWLILLFYDHQCRDHCFTYIIQNSRSGGGGRHVWNCWRFCWDYHTWVCYQCFMRLKLATQHFKNQVWYSILTWYNPTPQSMLIWNFHAERADSGRLLSVSLSLPSNKPFCFLQKQWILYG